MLHVSLTMYLAIGQLMWRLYGSLAEDSAPIVSNLITSDCIVKPYCVKSATYFKGFDYRVCPTIAQFGGDIDSTSSIVRAKKRIGSPSTDQGFTTASQPEGCHVPFTCT